MRLYPYQIECLDTIKEHFESENSQLIQLPTGAGKTVIFLHYIKRHSERSLILVPTKELIEQIQDSGDMILFPYAVRRHLEGHHVVQTFHSLACTSGEKIMDIHFDHIIVDEAHHVVSNTISTFLKAYMARHPTTKVMGFTATPERKDKKSLLEIFGKLTFDMNILDLVNKGFLCDLKGYRVKTGCSIDNRQQACGDFRPLELRKLINEDRDDIIISAFKQKCKKRKTIVFCINVEHSASLAKRFREEGYTAEYIHGGMNLQDRKAIVARFKAGQTQVLTNCQILTEGFDEPSIEAVLLARPTKSKALYCQMLGRGLRIHRGKKDCVVVDFSDQCMNICNFNMSVSEDYCDLQYPDGTSIKDLSALLDKYRKLHTIDVTKTVMESFNILEQKNQSMPHLPCQMADIRRLKIKFFSDVSFQEAAFMLWMHNLKVSIG